MKPRVAVGLSGGVDSSVAAYLLQQQGYEVVGVFMKNWHNESLTVSQECPWWEDGTDALLVAGRLSIPFQTVDLSQIYGQQIVEYMLAEYGRGRTPNPDVMCNHKIKFEAFADLARQLGADFVATGHYCRKEALPPNRGADGHRLLAGRDAQKDQSYFLCQLTQRQLATALFPLGELSKAGVRSIARGLNLPTADKKDSQGLCFVGKVRLPVFLSQSLKPKNGKVIAVPPDSPALHRPRSADLSLLVRPYAFDAALGAVVGEHHGAHYYTIGQRKGLQIGGWPNPLFVLATDTNNNIVYVGAGKDHPGLYRRGLFVPAADEHWIRADLRLKAGESTVYQARIRYRQTLELCEITKREEGLYVVFERPQRGIAPGQFVAWYADDELVGSGVID